MSGVEKKIDEDLKLIMTSLNFNFGAFCGEVNSGINDVYEISIDFRSN